MARKDTVNALIRRGVSARVSETIANAGFKIGDLKKTPFEILTKIISEEDAQDLLDKIGAKKFHLEEITPAAPKKVPVKAEPDEKKVRKSKKRRTDLIIPHKIMELTADEKKIDKIVKKKGFTLPTSILGDLAVKAKTLKITDSKLEKIIGEKVTIEFSVKPSILGGMIARVNGSLIDGSIQNKLNTLKKELSGARE